MVFLVYSGKEKRTWLGQGKHHLFHKQQGIIVEWWWSKESTDPPTISDLDEGKSYKSGKVTKYMGHVDFKDFLSAIPCVQLWSDTQMENTMLKLDEC